VEAYVDAAKFLLLSCLHCFDIGSAKRGSDVSGFGLWSQGSQCLGSGVVGQPRQSVPEVREEARERTTI
jgi:hypothetical protein